LIDSVFELTVTSTGEALTLPSFKVTPSTTSSSVLLAEVTVRPLTVARALAAACVRDIEDTEAEGS
jgi:hypothetical protein